MITSSRVGEVEFLEGWLFPTECTADTVTGHGRGNFYQEILHHKNHQYWRQIHEVDEKS